METPPAALKKKFFSRKRITKKTLNKTEKQTKKFLNKKKNKSLPKLFFRSLSLLFLLMFLAIFYFLILISFEYKSFPFATKTIESLINQNLNINVKIDQSKIKFINFHIFDVKLEGIKLELEGQELALPQISTEFALIDLLSMRLRPSKLTILNPEIIIDSNIAVDNLPVVIVNGVNATILLKNNLQQISQFLLSLKNNNVPIKSFAIANGKIIIKHQQKEQQILLKKAEINSFFLHKNLQIQSQNIISFDPKIKDLIVNFKGNFDNLGGFRGGINFNNLDLSSIPQIDQRLLILKSLSDVVVDGSVNLVIGANQEIKVVDFNINVPKGSFNLPKLFSKKINFQDLKVKGGWNVDLNKLRIEKLSTNFGQSNFIMSLLIDNFTSDDLQTKTLHFAINNTPTNDLEFLWPLFLNEAGVRSWVTTNIKNGVIKDGFADLVLENKNGHEKLSSINAKLNFSGLNLNYSNQFPNIKEIDGSAYFSKNEMKIDITKAKVLTSRINNANIAVPSFNSASTMLNIKGKVEGDAIDLLKHIDYKSNFANQANDYFKGFANTSLDIRLPINQKITLKNSYIKVKSDVKNFDNVYIGKDSNPIFTITKNFATDDFVAEIDLNKAKINLPILDIAKPENVESKISTTISLVKNQIDLKNFNWQQQDNKSLKGNLTMQIKPFEITEVSLNNKNFANSNFQLNYKITSNKSRFIEISGKNLDLTNFLVEKNNDTSQIETETTNQNKVEIINGDIEKIGAVVDIKGTNSSYLRNKIQINLDKIILANQQQLKGVNINVDCQDKICRDGIIKGNLTKDKNINIVILKPKLGKDGDKRTYYTEIKGNIDDISVLAKGLNFSNKIIGGSAELEAKIDQNRNLVGMLRLEAGFKILKNPVVEKISNNSIFSSLKDKILNSNEINFDNLKLEFALKNNVLTIDNLIASSQLMAFTAKGTVNLNKRELAFKGLIVPGYGLNKIFGIGQVPILGKIIVGEEGGGVFAIRYDYIKNSSKDKFTINPASAIIPGGIRNVFDLF